MAQSQPKPPVVVWVTLVCLLATAGWFLGTFDSPTGPAASRLVAPSTQPSETTPSTAGAFQRPYPSDPHAGNLPDDTQFLGVFSAHEPAKVRAISAAIMIDRADGSSAPFASITFPTSNDQAALSSRLGYQRQYEEWTLRIEPYADAAPATTGDLEAWMDDHIVSLPGRIMPAFTLISPLRWADDAEGILPMEVVYGTFSVRRGCSTDAASCSESRAVQLIPESGGLSGEGSVISPNPRPRSDAAYLDPGPLSARRNHLVTWTGSELIVWGGDNEHEFLVDGAAYDPATNSWRWLSPSPLEPGLAATSVWADDHLVAFNSEQTVAYFPAEDVWRTLGSGIAPPDSPTKTVWTGGAAYTWTDGLYRFDPPAWTKLPSPGANPRTAWETSLTVFDETVYATFLPWGDCSSRKIARWNGVGWTPTPPPVQTSNHACAGANQVLALHPLLYAWGNDMPLSVYDPRTHTWSNIGRLPELRQPGSEHRVGVADRILVSEADRGWLYSPSELGWQPYQLPGQVLETTTVWTGSQLLNWGRTCCYAEEPGWGIDAWQFSFEN
ncbi:MAG: hypothetical protein OEM40_02240 [Acidimicrobiia bacterium]|nr:hypothetical protein [Acidimicrobiia bacterium]